MNDSHRCPKGNRQMRRVLNQAANAGVKAKGIGLALAAAWLSESERRVLLGSASGQRTRGTRDAV